LSGTTEDLKKTIPIIPGVSGLRDERVVHEGMPSSGVKYVLSQWCHEDCLAQDADLEDFNVQALGGAIL
jgi:hypothetical protein